MAERGRGRGSGFWARDYGENGPVFGQFHQKCGEKVVLTEGRTVASGSTSSLLDPFPSPPIAFSNDPIPKGVPFSVKVLQEGKEKVSPLMQSAVYALLGSRTHDSSQLAARVFWCR